MMAEEEHRMVHTRYSDIQAYTTKDGSLIRELMHPSMHGNTNQSLAEAIVPEGATTLLHKHFRSEEIYHITAGQGLMTLGSRQFQVNVGDTVCINPTIEHCITNTGQGPLKILCASAPAYSHADTELVTASEKQNSDR